MTNDEIEPLIAERIRAAQEQAWDEGHAAPADGWHWEGVPRRPGMWRRVDDPTPNPYRKADS